MHSEQLMCTGSTRPVLLGLGLVLVHRKHLKLLGPCTMEVLIGAKWQGWSVLGHGASPWPGRGFRAWSRARGRSPGAACLQEGGAHHLLLESIRAAAAPHRRGLSGALG